MAHDRPAEADDDPRGRPVVLHTESGPEDAVSRSRRNAVARALAAVAVATTLAAGTTVVVTQVLTPSVPEADRAPLWFRPPPLAAADAPAPAGPPGTSAGRPAAFDERVPPPPSRQAGPARAPAPPRASRAPATVRHAEPGDDKPAAGGRTAAPTAPDVHPESGDDHSGRGSGDPGQSGSSGRSGGGGHSGKG